MRIYTADGKLIGEFGDVRRIPVELEQVPRDFINALIATEDQRFFEHGGVDIQGLLRVIKVALFSGEFSEGASTLTMQTARNMFLTRDQRLQRKLVEMFLAIKMEEELSKEEILEIYVNKVHFSHRAYGLGAAAQVYYGKELTELTLPQAAMMAGLLKGESAYNPISNPERAFQRRNLVLSRMVEQNYIAQAEYEEAVATPLTARKHTADLDLEAPYVAEMARIDVINKFGREVAYNQGLIVQTTIDSKQQKVANEALRQGLLEYDRRHGYKGPELVLEDFNADDKEALLTLLESTPTIGPLLPAVVLKVDEKSIEVLSKDDQVLTIDWSGLEWAAKFISDSRIGNKPEKAADIVSAGSIIRVLKINEDEWHLSQIPEASAGFVAMSPHDGSITALVGGFDFSANKFNLVTQARRQPGSNIKPFIYAAAFSKGYTAASLVNDAPFVRVNESIDEVWRPQNDNLKYNGPTRLRIGLKRSINTISTRLIDAIGADYTEQFLVNLGLPDEHMDPYQSLALGTASFTPLEMASAYAVLANGGYQVDPYYIKEISSSVGDVLYEASPMLVCDECQQMRIENQIREQKYAPEIRNEPALPMPEDRIAKQVVDPRDAFIIYDIMKDVIHSGTATTQLVRRNSPLLKRNDLAGKTGTANDYKDAWFSGFNREIVASAWVGFSDHRRSLGQYEYGGRAALPIWATFMEQVLEGTPSKEMIQPPGVVSTKIDPETGKLASLGQTNGIFEFFRDDNVPTEVARQEQEDFNTIYNTQQDEKSVEQLFDDEMMRLLDESPTDSDTTEDSSREALERQLDEELKQLQKQSDEEQQEEEATDPGSIF
ncbi:penicillin-binding protein 1A [Kangiella sp.]|uniref:penicillin-binding protein 1A n=1 Tax=Kangiella sp. TaxID=1920245 RepID=UPI0025C3BBCA|nr:penicillin-binding protein 1A [Kangiella sp.]